MKLSYSFACVLSVATLMACGSSSSDAAGGDAGNGKSPPPPVATQDGGGASADAGPIVLRETPYVVPQFLADEGIAEVNAAGDLALTFIAAQQVIDEDVPAWTAAQLAAAKDAVDAMKKLPPGTLIAAPATLLPRTAAGMVDVIYDLPSCGGSSDPNCAKGTMDPVTGSLHLPVQAAGVGDTVNRLPVVREGMNFTGVLFRAQKVDAVDFGIGAAGVVGANGGKGVTFTGSLGSLGDVVDTGTASSLGTDGADADGFFPLPAALSIDFSGRTLLTDGPVALSISSGSLDAKPKLKTVIQTAGGKIAHAELGVRADIKLNATLALSVTESFDQTYTKDIQATLFETQLPLPPVAVGVVPVYEALKFQLLATCHLGVNGQATVSAGVIVEENVTLGATYDAGAFQNASAAPSPSVSASGPTLDVSASTTASCAIVPTFSLLVYDVIGPYISLSAGTTFDASGSISTSPGAPPTAAGHWQLDVELSAEVGLVDTLAVPGFGPLNQFLSDEMKNARLTLFDTKIPLASSGPP